MVKRKNEQEGRGGRGDGLQRRLVAVMRLVGSGIPAPRSLLLFPVHISRHELVTHVAAAAECGCALRCVNARSRSALAPMGLIVASLSALPPLARPASVLHGQRVKIFCSKLAEFRIDGERFAERRRYAQAGRRDSREDQSASHGAHVDRYFS